MQNIIQALIPQYEIYAEPFAGAAATLFHLQDWKGKVEILNDKNNLLGNFYRVAKNPGLFKALMTEVSGTLHNENDFRKAIEIYSNPGKYHRVEKAWAVWAGFNMAHFATIHPGAGFRFDISRVCAGKNKEASKMDTSKKNAIKLATRLERVTITCIDGIKFINKIDRSGAFFFIDTPYPGCNQGHFAKFGFGMPEFINLLEILGNIKGKFLLTSGLYPELEAAQLKNRWNHKEIDIKSLYAFNNNGVVETKTKIRKEVFTWNYQENYRPGGLFQ